MDTLNRWVAAIKARDLDAHMSYYADTLDTYYKSTNVSASQVREERMRAYERYSELNVQLSNINIMPGPSGTRATAIFDKTWTFSGERYSSGSVQQQIWLEKRDGRWLITGEKDLQVYY